MYSKTVDVSCRKYMRQIDIDETSKQTLMYK